jgi:uncharacterized membrane protein HdeD (DUF308 family)
LMVNGFSRISDGLTNKSAKRLIRGFTIGIGIYVVIISIGVISFPWLGALFTSKLIAVELIIIGIQMIISGTVNVEAGKKKMKEKIKKIFQRHERSGEKKSR